MTGGSATLGALFYVIKSVAPFFCVALVILDVLRFWGLSMMRARDPEFYEWLGSPELIAGHWGYFPSGWLQRAVADPAFGELTTSVRFAMRAAYLFNLIASALFGVILFMMAMMVIVRLLM